MDGDTALHVAVKLGSLMTIKYLINYCKLDPYKSNHCSRTPLYVAVCDGNLSVVKCLFSECSSVIPDAPVDDKGNTALHVATEHYQLSMIKCLINECKLSPNNENQYTLTPLNVAFSLRKLDVAEYLITEFPGIVTCTDAIIDWHGNTALHVAVKHGLPLVIKYLVNEVQTQPQ